MDPTTHISLCEEALSDNAREALRQRLAHDPVLLEQTRLWAALCERAFRDVEAQLPPREDLFSVALLEAGLLGDADVSVQSAVRDLQDAIKPVRREYPSVDALLRRMTADARAFQDTWLEHVPASNSGHARSPKQAPLRLLARPVPMWSAAAAVTLLAVAALFLLRAPDSMRISVPDGTTQTVDLADGSTVLLAGPAELSWQDGASRHVSLEGRGFFDVAPQEDPFDVTTDHAVTTVTGTSFGVETGLSGTQVTVVSGRVHVRPRNSGAASALVETTLDAGQTARVAPGAVNAPRIAATGLDPLAWTGLFIFRDTPMDSVAQALEGAFNVDIDIHESLRQETLTGTFDRDQEVGDILVIVAAALGAELETHGDEPVYRLVRRETARG